MNIIHSLPESEVLFFLARAAVNRVTCPAAVVNVPSFLVLRPLPSFRPDLVVHNVEDREQFHPHPPHPHHRR